MRELVYEMIGRVRGTAGEHSVVLLYERGADAPELVMEVF
jgi:hypothetical protein